MAKTLSFTDTSPQTVKIGDTTTSFTLVCGNDNVATDLTNATSITVKLGNDSGYLKSATVNPTSLTDPTTGQVAVKFNADLMTSLPAGSYAIEIWVVDSTGTSIYPSDGSTGFTITNNIQSANGSTITTITFDDFVKAMNEAASTIAKGEKGDKGDKGDTGSVDNAGLTAAPAFVALKTQVNDSAVGTNLVKDSEQEFSGKAYTLCDYNLGSITELTPGGTYTMSFSAKVDDNAVNCNQRLFVDVYNPSWSWNSEADASSTDYQRVTKTFTVPEGQTGVAIISAYLSHPVINGNPDPSFDKSDIAGTGYIKEFKLEKGSVATDWCPNPTEVLTQSDYAETPAFQALQTQVNNSAVGTNLLTGTSDFTGWTLSGGTEQGTTDGLTYAHLFVANSAVAPNLTLSESTTYTVSFDALGYVAGTTPISIGYSEDSNGNIIASDYVNVTLNALDGASVRVSLTFTTSPSFTKANFNIGCGKDFPATNGSIYIRHVKLELGSHATPWCPNPTEILTQSDYAKIKAAIVALGGSLS